jgi:hypothetical protein
VWEFTHTKLEQGGPHTITPFSSTRSVSRTDRRNPCLRGKDKAAEGGCCVSYIIILYINTNVHKLIYILFFMVYVIALISTKRFNFVASYV